MSGKASTNGDGEKSETAATVLLLVTNGYAMPALQVLMSLSDEQKLAALTVADGGRTSLLHWFAWHSCLPAVKYLVEIGMNVSDLAQIAHLKPPFRISGELCIVFGPDGFALGSFSQ